ncbi:unnamed protein product, partial [Chrysoparadoxa australica]
LQALSSGALAALQEHLGKGTNDDGKALVKEDFGMSQFWYDEETQKALAREVLRVAKEAGGSDGGVVAILSAPSIMNGLALLKAEQEIDEQDAGLRVCIFEYDKRFGDSYPDQFSFYDFNKPLDVPSELHGRCDFLVADPPYLNEPTISQFLKSMDILSRDRGGLKCKQMFITSPLQHAFLATKGFRRTAFQLHFQSKFSTPISVFTNYSVESNDWLMGGWLEEEREEES